MIVVAKKGTKKIVKGHKYDVMYLSNSLKSRTWKTGNSTRVSKGYVMIKDIGRLSVDNFTDIDGNSIPEIDWGNKPTYRSHVEIDFSTLKKGDILVLYRGRYQTLDIGGKYRIADIKSTSRQVKLYNGTFKTVNDNKVKFEGLNRWFEFSSWKFRKLDVGESREIQLSSLFGEESDQKFVVDTKSRKIDKVDNKDVELIRIIAGAINDRYRHSLGVVEWACDKTGKQMKVEEADFKHLLKMPLKQILKLVETN